jgi:hypothetical protein
VRLAWGEGESEAAASRGVPTAAQQPEGAAGPGSENLADLQAALNEARGLDRSGKWASLMADVGSHKCYRRKWDHSKSSD